MTLINFVLRFIWGATTFPNSNKPFYPYGCLKSFYDNILFTIGTKTECDEFDISVLNNI